MNEATRDAFEQALSTWPRSGVPDNPEGWEVESGNIGQHYYFWRYHEIPAEVRIDLQPEVAENPLFIFDLDLLEIDPEDPGELPLFAIVGIDPTDDPIVLTPENVERIITLFAIFFGAIEMVDLEALTDEQLAILAEFEEETGIDLLEHEFTFEEDRPAAVTLLIQLETGQAWDREDLIEELVKIQYQRTETELTRGTLRVRGGRIDIFPSYGENPHRVELDERGIARIRVLDSVHFQPVEAVRKLLLYGLP
jgi:hypothetical protein